MLLHLTLMQVCSSLRWVQEFDNNIPVSDAPDRPGRRYDHASAAWEGKLYVSHGYQYDHEESQPQMYDDTWVFRPASGSWEQLRGLDPRPSPRMGATVAVSGESLFLYGGEDGGYHYSHTHVFGSYHSDLWQLILPSGPWKLVDISTALRPAARANHAMVAVDEGFVLFGGLTAEQTSTEGADYLQDSSELWLFNSATSRWESLPSDMGLKRHGAALVAVGRRLWLFGGSQIQGEQQQRNLADLWCYDLDIAQQRWVEVSQRGAQPQGRRSHGMALLSGKISLFGGASCKPGCTCLAGTYLLDTRACTGNASLVCDWQHWDLNSPTARYRHSMTTLGSSVYLFGGESYQPYSYYQDVWVLQDTHQPREL